MSIMQRRVRAAAQAKATSDEKREAARLNLPDELRQIYDEMLSDYQHAAFMHHGWKWVSYSCIAELVRAGWRCTGEPIETWAIMAGEDK